MASAAGDSLFLPSPSYRGLSLVYRRLRPPSTPVGGLGRIIRDSQRVMLQRLMVKLRDRYRAALKDTDRFNAFMELFRAWDNEAAAMIYQAGDEVYHPIDLLNLTAVVDNRREIERLRATLAEMQERLASMQ